MPDVPTTEAHDGGRVESGVVNFPAALANVGTPTVPTDLTSVIHDAEAHRVLDGDTVEVVLHGIAVSPLVRVRIAGINAPEIHAPASLAEIAAGVVASAALRSLLWDGTSPRRLLVRVRRLDKFGGRLAADLWTAQGSVAASMIVSGNAIAWDGTGPKPPWTPKP